MLASSDIIAFVPSKDSAKARAFYEGVLASRFISDDGFALVLNANGIMIRVVKAQQLTPVQYTILGWTKLRKRSCACMNKAFTSNVTGSSSRTISESGPLAAVTRWPGSKTPTAIHSLSQSIKTGKIGL